jgi:hypothetical protein
MKLHVYITNWRVPASGFAKFKSELLSFSRNLTEFRKGTGVPTFIEPLILILKSLYEIKEFDISIKIISNVPVKIEYNNFLGTSPNKSFEIENYVYDVSLFNSPFQLSNRYINHFKDDLVSAGKNDIFIYLEHDQLFTQSNLDYFLHYSDYLNQFNLRPGYLRVEWSGKSGEWIAPDLKFTSGGNLGLSLPLKLSVTEKFVTFGNPYYGFSIHTLISAKRFFEFSDNVDSNKNLNWGTTEISAMTDLLNTDISLMARKLRFTSISPVALRAPDNSIHPGALAWHLSNRYANTSQLFKRRRGYGSVSLTDVSSALKKL